METKNGTLNDLATIQLGKFAEIVMGQSPPGALVNNDGNGLPFLQGNADFGSQYPSPRYWCNASGRVALTGDILISVRAPVGEMNRADQSYMIGRGLAAVRVPKEDIEFLWQSLQFSICQLGRVSQGSTFDAINKEDLESLQFVLLPAAVRRYAAKVLHAVDRVADETRNIIDQMHHLRIALLQDLLTRGIPKRHKKYQTIYRIGMVPTKWTETRLGDVAEITQGIALDPNRMPRICPAPYLRVANVQKGHLDLSEIKQIEVTAEELQSLSLHINDVLMVEGHANIEELGRAALVSKGAEGMVFQNHLFRVRSDRKKLDPRFLVTWINSPAGRNYFKIFGGTTSGLNTVGSGHIRRLRLPLPDIEEQQTICDVVSSVDQRIQTASMDLAQINSVKHALSQGILTGQIPITISKDSNAT